MTIMLAGGMTIAIPGVMPDVSAQPGETANLYVSATKFGGPMILEVIVRDPNLSQTDEDKAEPNVTFDDHTLRMVQATDGYWYAYVADKESAKTVDEAKIASSDEKGVSLDFGTLCDAVASDALFKKSNVDADATFVSGSCDAPKTNDTKVKVLKSVKTLNEGITSQIGNTDLEKLEHWPFIQLFDFTDDATIKVVYNAGGSNQQVSLTYSESMDDDASYSLDRSSYPHGADVHLTISDNQLNIDPTSDDIWTFDTTGDGQTYYNMFDKNGVLDPKHTFDYLPFLTKASFGDNGVLKIDPSPNSDDKIIKFVDNGNQVIDDTDFEGSALVTVQETSPNSGVFSSTDNAHKSVLKTTTTTDEEKLRGLSFTIDYKDDPTNFIVNFFQGLVKMDLTSIASDWGSGESLTVNITDQDENKNTLKDDDFAVSDSRFGGIPTVEIGSPETLAKITTDVLIDGDTTASKDSEKDRTKELADLNAFVTASQGTTDAITDKTAVQTANQTTWETLVTEKQGEYDRSVAAGGVSSDFVNNLKDEIANAKLGVKQAKAAVVAQLNSTDIATLAELVTSKQRIDELNKPAPTNTPPDQVSIPHKPLDFSKLLSLDSAGIEIKENAKIVINTNLDFSVLNAAVETSGVHQLLNYNFESLNATKITVKEKVSDRELFNSTKASGLEIIKDTNSTPLTGEIQIVIQTDLTASDADDGKVFNMALDFFKFGQAEDGTRYNDAIYRLEAEETGTNTGIYSGTLEYVMLNQINIFKEATFTELATIGVDLNIIVAEDMTDEDAVELIYLDRDGQGNPTQNISSD